MSLFNLRDCEEVCDIVENWRVSCVGVGGGGLGWVG